MMDRVAAPCGTLVALYALGLTGCEPQPQQEEQPEIPPAEEIQMDEGEQPMPPLALVTFRAVDFQPGPAAGDRPVRGTLRLMLPRTGDSEGMHLYTRIEGLEPGEHAWHIHAAECGEEGPVVVPFTPTEEQEGLDRPLVGDPDGAAMETAFVPADLLTRQQIEEGAYSVHVHERSGVDHGETVACADL